MKQWISALLLCAMLFCFPHAVCAAEAPETGAEAMVLYCVENGSIILSKNKDKEMRPASTTKLMTTLLTLEEAAKNDRVVTFTQEMTAEG
ncbi:MAG: D-alanyl-D-alanine carboxypeptidase, partial [Ruminococcus sp.]|nr:D-alanyl-D-alanine carboxypeptidase [Ruminococcus sp.]